MSEATRPNTWTSINDTDPERVLMHTMLHAQVCFDVLVKCGYITSEICKDLFYRLARYYTWPTDKNKLSYRMLYNKYISL